MTVRIVLFHATPVAMQPIHDAFNALWPEAEIVNLLDDGLSIDLARAKQLNEQIIERFVRLGQYGYEMKADAILATCSAFGPALDKLAALLPVPVLKPNEAMFREAITRGQRIGMLATFGPAVAPMEQEFRDFVDQSGCEATLKTVLVEEAMTRLKLGDVAGHNQLLVDHLPQLADCDAIMLAHFSTSRAWDAVSQASTIPVLSAPHAAVKRVRRLLEASREPKSC